MTVKTGNVPSNILRKLGTLPEGYTYLYKYTEARSSLSSDEDHILIVNSEGQCVGSANIFALDDHDSWVRSAKRAWSDSQSEIIRERILGTEESKSDTPKAKPQRTGFLKWLLG